MQNRLFVLPNKGNLKLKESSKAIVGSLLHLGNSRNGSGKYGDAPPLRAELFSAEQMKQHGRTLAGLHKLSPGAFCSEGSASCHLAPFNFSEAGPIASTAVSISLTKLLKESPASVNCRAFMRSASDLA